MVRIGTDYYWDGGLVSNTPLQYLLETTEDEDSLVFQVDLFSARGQLPRDMYDVMARQKDIQYSSRTRLVTDYFRRTVHRPILLKRVLDNARTNSERRRTRRQARARSLPDVTILHLIYQQTAYEGQAKDYEFSGTSMREHWHGLPDIVTPKRTLRHKDWLAIPDRRRRYRRSRRPPAGRLISDGAGSELI